MENWSLRAITRADHPQLVAINNQHSLEPMSLAEFEHRLHTWQNPGPYAGLAAVRADGTVLGQGALNRATWRLPGTFWLSVQVDRRALGQGIGSALYAALEQQAREWQARYLITNVRDDVAAGRSFAEQRGFQVIDHFFHSELDLTAFDPAPFRPLVAQAEAQGYQFVTLAQVDGPEARRELYDLDMDCARDEPGQDEGSPWPPVSYEDYSRQVLGAPGFDPAAVYVAVKDGRWAALSGVTFPPGREETALVFFTGVRREYRGQRLAQALKLLVGEYARERSIRRIVTGNHESNPAMLAVNRKFGFQPLPGSYTLRKEL